MNNKQDWCRFMQCKQKKDQKLFWLCVFSTLKKKAGQVIYWKHVKVISPKTVVRSCLLAGTINQTTDSFCNQTLYIIEFGQKSNSGL